jgi:hypothetical protein
VARARHHGIPYSSQLTVGDLIVRDHHPSHKHCRISPALQFIMRFSLATLATVALATQTATADWLSGKAGKSSLMAQPIWV